MTVEGQLQVVNCELDWGRVLASYPSLVDVPEMERAIVAYKCMGMSDTVIAEITGLQAKTVKIVCGRWPICLTAKRDEALRKVLIGKWVDDGLMRAANALQRVDVEQMGAGELSRHVKCLVEIKRLVGDEERGREVAAPRERSVAELAAGLVT